MKSIVGARGIEPRLQDPQPCVLPLYDAPLLLCLHKFNKKKTHGRFRRSLEYSSIYSHFFFLLKFFPANSENEK